MPRAAGGQRLVRRPAPSAEAPVLDASQQAAVDHRGGPLLLYAGPGTGKTTTLVEAVVSRIDAGLPVEAVLALTFSRRAARELRERIAARIGRASVEPLARTFHSYAFGVLRREAAVRGEPSPRLLSAAEQDTVVRELLRGDMAAGGEAWPPALHAALGTGAFAQELRDLLLRCAEQGVTPERLAGVARAARRDDWRAVARFARQYADVTGLAFDGAYDPAELVGAVSRLWRESPDRLADERSARRFVVVDELQDADAGQLELLELLAGDGGELLAAGDPDQSIYGFRGADPGVMGRFADRFRPRRGKPARTLCLETSRRSGTDLLAATRRVAARLGSAGAHRRLVPASGLPAGGPEVHLLRSPAQEGAYLAARMRRAHLVDAVPWSQMAVLVRSAGALPPLRRALTAAGVPVARASVEVPLADTAAVAPLLLLLRCALSSGVLDEAAAEALLLSPFGGGDPLTLRRLALEWRSILSAGSPAESIAVGEGPLGILASALRSAQEAPENLALLSSRGRAPLERIASLLAIARGHAESTAEEMLWAVWSASGLAERWAELSMRGGDRGARADRDLDAVMSLFSVAGRFSDRLPRAGMAVLLEELEARSLPDSGPPADGGAGDGVVLLTAHAAKGLEWDFVAVAAVQEGAWPDLRVRTSLLDGGVLLARAAGGSAGAASIGPSASAAARVTEHTRVLAEERRLFYVAVTRARRQLLVTASASEREELSPSRFLDELDPPAGDEARPVTDVPRPLELSALTAELRSTLVEGAAPAGRLDAAARLLARLASHDVEGADPAEWYALQPLSDAAAVCAEGDAQKDAEGDAENAEKDAEDKVPVSPSKVEAFLRCELRWFLESVGATTGDTGSAGIGTLVHAAAAEAGTGDAAALLARLLDAAEARGEIGAGWVARRTREQATAMVARLETWLAANPRRLVAAELAFEVDLGRARLRGRVDRLEQDDDGRAVVVDLKTGATAVPRAEVVRHPQLAVYQLAVDAGAFADAGVHAPGGAELVQLGGAASASGAKVQAQPALAAEELREVEETVQRVAEGMAGSAFTAMDNNLCRVCPVRASCPVRDDGRSVVS